ncbi:MAG: hypothetical protein ABSD67_08905 [Terracidiphilus sp.]|jgi:hypothetical protein
MRIGQVISSFGSFALMLGVSQGLLAQTGATVSGGSVTLPSGVVGITSAGAFAGPMGITGAPYSATRKTTRVQKLANGTTITHVNTVKEARDSSGRTYHESRPEIAQGAEGEASSFVFVNVHDPVNRINISWNSGSKVANVIHMPEPGQIKRIETQPAAENAAPMPMMRPEAIKPQFEELGMKTINGVEAKGTRTTRVIPVGREGNDQPLTVIHESWVSPELRIVVMSSSDDPRSGTSTMELTDIERSEPDPVLFQVPEGYTVKERTPGLEN